MSEELDALTKAAHTSENKWVGPGHGYETVCTLCGEVYPCATLRSMQ